MKALVGSFNKEKALVGAFFVIVKTDCETNGSFYSTRFDISLVITAIITQAGTGDSAAQQLG